MTKPPFFVPNEGCLTELSSVRQTALNGRLIFGSGGGDDGAALCRAAGKILGQLAMPFLGLGGNGALRGGPLFCCAAHVIALI